MSEGTKRLPWSDEEIVRHYRAAKDPAEMIMILAELNGTTAHRIREVLSGVGINPPQSRPTKRQTAHLKTVLADENGQYAFRKVERMHGLTVGTLRHRVEHKKKLVLDGHVYQVRSYHRRG